MDVRKFLLLMLVVCTGIVTSCKYDDDELWGSVDDLANRVATLETLTKQMNGDIAAMQVIVTALENQVGVSEVEKLTDGYILHFTNGKTATIKNGTDGKDGADGKDAPIIGFAEVDGVYYWTLTVDGKTDWLTDESGNKLMVSTGANTNGSDGSAGTDGSDGRTPTLKVDNEGYWMISYDDSNYEYIKDVAGNKVNALGTNGKPLFNDVIPNENKGTLTIVMNNDTHDTFVLPLLKSIEFFTDEACTTPADIKNIPWNGAGTEVTYFYKLNMENASYEVVDDAGMDVAVDTVKNSVTLSLKGNVVANGRLVLLFFDDARTLTAVFKFVVAPWDGTNQQQPASAEVNNHKVYSIATPANLAWVAKQVNDGDQNFENDTIRLVNDIDLADKNWTPIGSAQKPFKGVFDGNGKTISGLSVSDKVLNRAASRAVTVDGAGLFGVVENATLKNVIIKDATVEAETKGAAGILVGCALGTVNITDVIIVKEESTAETDVNGSQNVGSVAGYISGDNVTISGCEVQSTNLTASSSESATSVGGVVGTINLTSDEAVLNIENCTVGGVEISSSVPETETSEKSSAGGIIGSLTGSNVSGENLNISSNTVSDATVVVPDGAVSEDIDMGSVVGSTDPEVKEEINESNTGADDLIVEGNVTIIIKNEGLSAALKDLYPDDVTLKNDFAIFTKEFAETITDLEINPNYEENKYSITTLDGIENFPYLVNVICRNTGLQSCDLSANPLIETVWIEDNDVKSLDFSKNKKLRMLMCSNNPNLTSVNIVDCELLEAINVNDNKNLAELELYNPSVIYDLSFNDTQLSFDLSKFTGLHFLACNNMNLGVLNLNIKTKAQIRGLECAGNSLKELNLKEYPELITLYCRNNQISELIPSYCVNLEELICDANLLTKLDVFKLENLNLLFCGNQKKGTLTLTLNDVQKKNWENEWKTDKNNAGVVLEGEETSEGSSKEVATWKEVALAAQNSSVTNIILTAPVVADAGIDLRGKTLTLSKDFNFGESKAAIMFNGAYGLSNGTFKASSSNDIKYMISSKVGLELCYNFELIAEGSLNGVYVEDNGCAIYDNTSITVEKGHAFKAVSNNAKVFLQMDANATINGNVFLEANNPSIGNNNIHLMGNADSGYGRINGDVIIISVQNVPTIYVNIAKEGLITGEVVGGKVMVENPGQGGENPGEGGDTPGEGGENPDEGGNEQQGGNTNGNNFWFENEF